MATVTKQYPSSSSSAVYTAQFDPATGESSCNCKGWTVKRGDKPRSCKHTVDLTAIAGGAKPSATLGRTANAGAPAVKPMLASAFPEGSTLADFSNDEWVLEEKFDGHRLLVVVSKDKAVTAWSRPGADRPSAERALPAGLVADLSALPDGVYDGELTIPGGTSSDVTRLDRKDALVFVAFDAVRIFDQDLTDKRLDTRRSALALAVAHAPKGGRVRLAEQTAVSAETVKAIWARGGEGAILKKKSSTYRSGWRTPNWVKVKAIGSAELTLTGFSAGKMGPQSVMNLRHDDGRETTVKVLGNEWLRVFDRAAALGTIQNEFIGKRVAISFMGMTTGNQWRHPQFDHFVQEG
jgi:ATP-dependent DNA ligase